jgi:transcriptional regulator with XRE-family HTH domain
VDKSNYLHILGHRLAQERARLGLTQAQVATIASVARRTQVNYENGERAPDASYLESLGENGFDALYVLTGRREHTGTASRIAEPSSAYKLAGLNAAHVRAAAIAVLDQLAAKNLSANDARPIDTARVAEAIVVLAEMSESIDDVARNASHVVRLLP